MGRRAREEACAPPRPTLLILLILPLAAPVQAQMCDGTSVSVGADGRVLGHLPYGDAAPGSLVDAPPGVAIGGCALRPEAMADLQRLLDAAAGDPATQGRLYAVSCHRSIARQAATFCRAALTARGDDRAISVAPPGHSEHATGYALDFTVRPADGCPDTEACMAAKPAFRWLAANAPRFGFELSFPTGSPQNVKWEPWHWRWVGTSSSVPGAARARFVFQRARATFPANPGIDVLPKVTPPVAVRTLPDPPAEPVKRQKRGKRDRRTDQPKE